MRKDIDSTQSQPNAFLTVLNWIVGAFFAFLFIFWLISLIGGIDEEEVSGKDYKNIKLKLKNSPECETGKKEVASAISDGKLIRKEMVAINIAFKECQLQEDARRENTDTDMEIAEIKNLISEEIPSNKGI